MKLSVIFPVYNERATVREVLDELLAFEMDGLEKEIIIVEGNSTDGTREVIGEYEAGPGVRVFYEERPKGKGAAVRKGLSEVSGDIVLIQDGDLEYKISDYPKVLTPIMEGKADIVFGTRAADPETHWQYRKFHGFEAVYGFFVNIGGVFFTALFNFLYGTKLSDGATMFKVYRASLLKGLVLKSNGFDYDWEMQGKLAKRGCTFYETPISYKARSRAEGKKIVFWRDGILVCIAIIRYRFFD
jgi:glycosyltransferase involved in cell wall biosynthesis